MTNKGGDIRRIPCSSLEIDMFLTQLLPSGFFHLRWFTKGSTAFNLAYALTNKAFHDPLNRASHNHNLRDFNQRDAGLHVM